MDSTRRASTQSAPIRHRTAKDRSPLGWLAALSLFACAGAPTPRPTPVTPPSLAASSAPTAQVSPLEPVPLDRDLLTLAERARAMFLEDLGALVGIDSGTGDQPGLERVAAWLTVRLRALGGEVSVVPAGSSVGSVVLGRWQGKGTRDVMLMIHYDTVFPTGEAARRPFRVEGNRAFGPGVADAKGGIAMLLGSVDLLRARGSAGFRRLTVLFNPDEEKGSLGSRELIQKLAGEQDLVLSYEPPEGELVVVATNGVGLAELSVKGKASHAGTAPEQGRNAVLELAHQVLALRDLGDASKGTTLNWTVMHGGERPNVIPEAASATADVRYSDPDEIARLRRDALRASQARLVPGTDVTLSIESRRPPFARNAASEHLAELAQRVYLGLGRELRASPMRFGTDAGYAYRAGSARPVVLEGLGLVGAGLHSPDEWAELESIVPRLYLSVRLIELFAP